MSHFVSFRYIMIWYTCVFWNDHHNKFSSCPLAHIVTNLFIVLRAFKIQPVQFSSFTQSCPTLCDPMDCSTPGFPVHHQLSALAQTRVHWVRDAIQSPLPLSSPSRPAFSFSQHQGLFHWVSSSHQAAKVLEFQFQHQSFQWIFRTDSL